jgi:hypothetical protein
MQHDKYKSTYEELASVCYVFAKALINNHAKCRHSGHL